MDKIKTFLTFLESMKPHDPELVSAVMEGFSVAFEAKEPAIRTKPHPVFHAEDADVTDNKDHFPLGTVGQARNALARVNQYTELPTWWTGKSLKSLKKRVVNAVKKAYPSIEVDPEDAE